MRTGLLTIALLGFLAAPGCRTTSTPNSEPTPARTALDSLCEWREAERRRDLARGASWIAPSVRREDLEAHFRALGPRRPEPVRAPIEFVHLGERAGGSTTLHGALEPRGSGHVVVFFETVREDAERRLVPGGRFGVLNVGRSAERMIAAEHARWRGLHGTELAESHRELLWMLEVQGQATRVAAERGLRLSPFDPSPELLLAELRSRTPEDARELVLARLAPPTR